MRTRNLLALPAAVLLLASCGGSGDDTASEPPAVNDAPDSTATALPDECADSDRLDESIDELGDEYDVLVDAITAADLPSTVMLQSIDAVGTIDPEGALDSGPDVDVYVDVCEPASSEDQARAVATDLAVAVHDADKDGAVTYVAVYTQAPDGEGGLEDEYMLSVDEFGDVTWSDEDAVEAWDVV